MRRVSKRMSGSRWGLADRRAPSAPAAEVLRHHHRRRVPAAAPTRLFRALVVGLVAVLMPTVLLSASASAQPATPPSGTAQAGAQQAATRPPPTAQSRARARQAYARGQELHRAGQFTEAEAAFQEAYDAVPNPVVLIGIAEAREHAGNIPGAVAALERYLADRADAPDRAQIEQRVTALRTTPATLVISSEPPGASITLDRSAREETTPAEIEVPSGTHEVALQLDGREPVEVSVEATFGARVEVAETLPELAPEPEDAFGDDGDDEAGMAPEGEPPAVAEEGSSAAIWVAGGIGGAGLVAGTVLGFLALSEQADFDDSPSADAADRGERLALFADVAFGVAVAGIITAIVLYAAGDGPADELEADTSVAEVVPVVGPGGGGASLRLRF